MIRCHSTSTLFPYTTLFRSALGVIASAGQLALTKGYRTAPTGAIAVYAYTAVIYGALLGWIFWNEIPLWTTWLGDRKSIRLNSSHVRISYAVFCLKKKTGRK